MSSKNGTENTPAFYVGYLPLPGAQKRFVVGLVASLFLGMVAFGVIIATTQRNPGKTAVVSAEIATWSGTVYSEPYPMMVHDDGSIHLLIGIGKFGVLDRVAALEGQRCEVDGWALARSDRRAIQLDLASDAIRPVAGRLQPRPQMAADESGPVVLVGEIVDGKCYLGAMKPGDGKAHKACATLCIQGGLPPMFASRSRTPSAQLPLILFDGSTTLPPSALGLVGEPVEITGRLSRLGSLDILRIGPGDIRRWPGDAP